MPGTTTAPDDATRLMDILQRQRRIAEELESLAQRQGELIEGRRGEALLGILTRRQAAIDAMLAAQQEHREVMRAIDRDRIGEDLKQRIETTIDEINRRLESVMAIDERDKASLRVRRDEAQEELTAAGIAQQARSAYLGRSGSSAAARFADRQG